MNPQLREKAGLVYNIVESVILAMSVGMVVWLANVVISHGEVLATQGTTILGNTRRLDRIEQSGSTGLQSHIAYDDQRVQSIDKRIEKVETAVLVLQGAASDLKAISVRLEGLSAGQARIEKSLEEHMKERVK